MFFTSFVSSRIGAKRTLLMGLALIVIFAALAGASDSVGMIIGFRAGWGLGNALFISTALATIVGAASGGADSAVILYEAALGLGIAIGPLLGGALGSISWRGPFFGTAVLMAIGLDRLDDAAEQGHHRGRSRSPSPPPSGPCSGRRCSPSAWPPCSTTSASSACSPGARSRWRQPRMRPGSPSFGAHELGLIFCGWGIALAVTSVFVAPVLTRRFGRRRTLYAMLGALAIVMAVLAVTWRTCGS